MTEPTRHGPRCLLVSVYLHGDDVRPPDDDAAVGIAEGFLADYGGYSASVVAVDNKYGETVVVARAADVKRAEVE